MLHRDMSPSSGSRQRSPMKHASPPQRSPGASREALRAENKRLKEVIRELQRTFEDRLEELKASSSEMSNSQYDKVIEKEKEIARLREEKANLQAYFSSEKDDMNAALADVKGTLATLK